MRAAPFGVFAAGRPAEAARLVAIDGTVSHDGEGIYGGQAVAAGRRRRDGRARSTDAVIAAALSVVPEDSWTARSLRRAVGGRPARPARPGHHPARHRARGALRRGDRRLPLDGPGAGGRRPGLRRVRGGPRRLLRVGADRRQHGPRRRHHGGGGGRAGRGAVRRRRDPRGLGRRDRPGARQLSAVDGGLPRPGHRGAAAPATEAARGADDRAGTPGPRRGPRRRHRGRSGHGRRTPRAGRRRDAAPGPPAPAPDPHGGAGRPTTGPQATPRRPAAPPAAVSRGCCSGWPRGTPPGGPRPGTGRRGCPSGPGG